MNDRSQDSSIRYEGAKAILHITGMSDGEKSNYIQDKMLQAMGISERVQVDESLVNGLLEAATILSDSHKLDLLNKIKVKSEQYDLRSLSPFIASFEDQKIKTKFFHWSLGTESGHMDGAWLHSYDNAMQILVSYPDEKDFFREATYVANLARKSRLPFS